MARAAKSQNLVRQMRAEGLSDKEMRAQLKAKGLSKVSFSTQPQKLIRLIRSLNQTVFFSVQLPDNGIPLDPMIDQARSPWNLLVPPEAS